MTDLPALYTTPSHGPQAEVAHLGRDFLDDKNAYNPAVLEDKLREGFRKRRFLSKHAKDRQVDQMVMGKGLGTTAVESLKEGLYVPRKVLPPLDPKERQLFDRDILFSKIHDIAPTVEASAATKLHQSSKEGEPHETQEAVSDAAAVFASSTGGPPSLLSANSSSSYLGEVCFGGTYAFLHQLRSSHRVSNNISDARSDIDDNVTMTEASLSKLSAPLTFNEIISTASHLLLAMERGKLTEEVQVQWSRLPSDSNVDNSSFAMEYDGEITTPPLKDDLTTVTLQGAEEVEQFVRKSLLPKAYEVIATAHSAEWVLQYTVAFLRATPATNDYEAQMRLKLLSRCIRLLGNMETLSSILLSLEAKCEEYSGFTALSDTAEFHLGSLLTDIERTLDAVLVCPFPSRRGRLFLVENSMKKKLQRALLFLNEIDYSWSPNVEFHWKWKMKFLSDAFYRIHRNITLKYMTCSIGFIHESLYERVVDSRISGRPTGSAPTQPRVLVAQQIEYDRVIEKLSLQQVGMTYKGMASIIVGWQLCMAARYILRQSTSDFDPQWRFPMNEVSTVLSEKDVERTIAKMTSRAKRIAVGKTEKHVPSTTFLTQEE